MDKPRIFMSHSHKDNDFGIRLAKDLRAAFGDEDAVWLDASGGLRSGDHFWQVIERELKSRPIFLVVLSESAVSSKAVQMEIDMAIGQWAGPGGKLLIPVLLSLCEIRPILSTIEYENFTSSRPYEEALDRLVHRLRVWGADSDKREANSALPAGQDARPMEQWTPQQRKLREVVRLECRRNLVKVKGAWWSVNYEPPLEGGTEEMAFEKRLRVSRTTTPTWALRSLSDTSILESFSINEIESLHDLYDGLAKFDQLQHALAEKLNSPEAQELIATHTNWSASIRGNASKYVPERSYRFVRFNADTMALYSAWDGLCNTMLQRDNPIRDDELSNQGEMNESVSPSLKPGAPSEGAHRAWQESVRKQSQQMGPPVFRRDKKF